MAVHGYTNQDRGSGEKIEKACTSHNSASTCIECGEGYFNPAYYRAGCFTCRICDTECQPCAYGHFSFKENSKCLPWTNCSAIGLTVLEAGSATKDVQCSAPKSTTAWVLPTSVAPTPPQRERTQRKDETSTLENSVTSTKQSIPRNAMNWDTVTLILITVTLLMAMAGIILAVIIQTKKRKRNRGFIRSNRCKVPVQEESTDSESSLAKKNPA
ncbi:PREDICTED: tumor necrosis factor receptor superfamily member 4 [Nanorana parkeri]|uniref:tumor necrosis factor receptor superfamily member 4 n=1 Tax=Nanorana parkeri TaxID=125878 RepID=UPI0008542298|nr:PREDICTED: tumor necrosis factor receptor superfamily member 4 [Nanorana parkeri]